MKKAFLITGFNNWGKSSIINDIFNKKVYRKHNDHVLEGTYKFSVQEHSNDDWGIDALIRHTQQRIDFSPNQGQNLIVAFCPTKEELNDSRQLLLHTLKNYKIYLILIVHKWDNHASLNVADILSYYAEMPNLIPIIIDEKDASKKPELVKTKILEIMKSNKKRESI